MAIGPIESNIFTNQQLPNVASVAQAHHARVEHQELFAQSLAQEKEQEVLEVRPTEENGSINQENDKEKNQSQEQNQKNKKQDKKEPTTQRHILDIKV